MLSPTTDGGDGALAAADDDGDGWVSDADLSFFVDALYTEDLGPSGRASLADEDVRDVELSDPDGDGIEEVFSSEHLFLSLTEQDLRPLFPNAGANTDSDGDGIGDGCDLCVNLDDADTPGIDPDGDGIGNACDADNDNNGVVSTTDFTFFFACFSAGSAPIGSAGAEADANDFAVVSTADFGAFFSQFEAGVPGVSGLVCADATASGVVCPIYADLYGAAKGLQATCP